MTRLGRGSLRQPCGQADCGHFLGDHNQQTFVCLWPGCSCTQWVPVTVDTKPLTAREEFPLVRVDLDDLEGATGVVYTMDPAVWKEMCDLIDRGRQIEAAARAYVASDPPRPEWRALCDALDIDWRQR